MSEKSVNLFEEISASQEDTELVVRAAVSTYLLMPQKKKLLERKATKVRRWDVQSDLLKMCAEQMRVQRMT